MSVDSAITFAAGIREKIAQHLCSAYPNEGCGVLLALRAPQPSLQIVDAVPVRNSSDHPGHHYLLEPLEYSRLEDRLGKTDRRIVGVFHSHPDGVARPSQTDLESAMGLYEFLREDWIYVIQKVAAGRACEMGAWRLEFKRNSFVEIAMV